MLFRKEFLLQIQSGKIKKAFRRWDVPRVNVSSTLLTSIGVLQFTKIKSRTESSLTLKDAKSAGYLELAHLMKDLSFKSRGQIFEIHFKLIGADPRLKLREQTRLAQTEVEKLLNKLARLDKASKTGPWTKKLLQLIAKSPGKGSKILAEKMKQEQLKLKLNVRKLKNLGLTISLGTGYKISPRGKEILRKLTKP